MPHDCVEEGHDYQPHGGGVICRFCLVVVPPPVPMDHYGHSAEDSLTSTIFRSLDSMLSLAQYVFTSLTTTLKTGQLLDESANCSPGPCVWSTSGSSSPSPVSSSNGVTPSSMQSTPLTPPNTLRKRMRSSQPGT